MQDIDFLCHFGLADKQLAFGIPAILEGAEMSPFGRTSVTQSLSSNFPSARLSQLPNHRGLFLSFLRRSVDRILWKTGRHRIVRGLASQ
jgi:hypothetical protein